MGNGIEYTTGVYEPKACEVLHSNKNYDKRIHKASKIVKNTVTPYNIMMAYLNYYELCDIADNYTKGAGALILLLYQNLCDPYFLFIAYSSLKNKNAFVIDDVLISNLTLTAICSAEELDCAILNCTQEAKEWYHVRYRKRIKVTAHKDLLMLI